MKFILTKNSSRPSDYFTVKQKSLLQQTPQVIKMRPIISHLLHPCRSILRKVARALTILVSLATKVVRDTRDTHIPIWRMHQGTHQWLEAISESSDNSQLAEFDVEDCFLYTTRDGGSGSAILDGLPIFPKARQILCHQQRFQVGRSLGSSVFIAFLEAVR